MRSRFLGLAAILFTLTLTGCAAHHMKTGDRAAAVGDWATAEAEYRNALVRKPDEPGLKEKYTNAKVEAMKQAKSRATACLNERNFQCAQGQADYAANLDTADGEAQQLKTTVHKAYALDSIGRAAALCPSDAVACLQGLEQAHMLSNDPEVNNALASANASGVAAAVQQAGALKSQAAQPGANGVALYDRAIYLYQWASRSDPSKGVMVSQAQDEKRRWIDAEYERVARLGDEALARRDWRGAQAQYQAAESFRAGGRARPMLAYASLCGQGDAAFAAKDFRGAATAYGQAASMPEDRSRYAASQVQAVEIALQAEYARLLGAGDEASAHHDWPNATAQYAAAIKLRGGAPAAARLEYVQVALTGDEAAKARNWKAAADAYRKAASWPEDRDRYAATQLDRVEVKPWRIRVKDVVVRPVGPDGQPWAGRPSVALQNVLRNIMNGDVVNWHEVSKLPAENIATVVLEIALPDGRRFRSAPKQGVAPTFDADVVVSSNAFEDRTLRLGVLLVPPNGAPLQEIEALILPIKDVIENRDKIHGATILAIDTTATPDRGSQEGVVANLTPYIEPAAAAAAPTPH